jgi:SAM-dependent methyltransferase
VRWGSLRRTTPFSRSWGYERGTPIDRVYIEDFLTTHAGDVRGACLEILNADYTNRFGAARVTSVDILDIDPANTAATIVADLGERDSLPAERFDCIIFTQTLHLILDMETALANVWRALSPGGALLLTVPALGRHEARKGFHSDRWRVTKTGLEWLLTGLSNGRAEITSYGNVLSCAAFLYGVAAEELRPEELRSFDREFPLIVAARVVKQDVR